MKVALQLELTTAAPEKWAAGLAMGGDAAAWLAALAQWPGDPATVELYLLPGKDGPLPGGVLMVPPAPVVGRLPAGLQPYACLGGIYYPTNAALTPRLSEDEAIALADEDVVLLHPRLGTLRWAATEAVNLRQLVLPPERQRADWSLAQPGPVREFGIDAVIGVQPKGLEMFGDAATELGGAAGQPLPPTPEETQAENFGERMRDGAAKWIERLQQPGSAAGSGTGAGGGWSDKLAGWARERMAAMERRRERELNRLLHLLQENPEEGLKYAIPVSETGAGRGLASPSDRLTAHGTDFSMGGIGGGGAMDSWSASESLRRQLRRRYRELGNHELGAGNHRRAAYVFAELLGDMAAAAAALEQGGFYREAAALYQERLRQPDKAAATLARGGLLAEALAIYLELKHWRRAAETYERLGNDEGARGCWRRVVQEKLAAGERRAAARLLVERLGEVDEALQILAEAWPDDREAMDCLVAQFKLLGELERHDQARALVARLRTESPQAEVPEASPSGGREEQVAQALTLVGESNGMSRGQLQQRLQLDFEHTGALIDDMVERNLLKVGRDQSTIKPVVSEAILVKQVVPLADLLARVGDGYPEAGVRDEADSLALDLIGGWLPHAPRGAANQLVGILRRRHKDDVQLARDCDRYRRQHKPLPPPKPPAERLQLLEVDRFRLPQDVSWQVMTPYNRHFYAVGCTAEEICVLRGTWRGETAVLRLPRDRTAPDRYRLLVNGAVGVIFVEAPAKSFDDLRFAEEAPFYGEIQVRPWWTSPTVELICAGVVSSGNLWAVIRDEEGALQANRYSASGELRSTETLPGEPVPPGISGTFAGAADTVHCVIGRRWYSLAPGEEWLLRELPQAGVNLGRPLAPNMPAVADLRMGVAILHADCRRAATMLAHDLATPVAYLQPGELCAVLSASQNRLYRVTANGFELGSNFPGTGEDLQMLMPTGVRNRFAALRQDGFVSIYEMTPDE